eukprot:1820768-Pleurochrysis_carterae.AAC.1
MACLASNKDRPVYPAWLSLKILPLRPSREIKTVPAVNITRYRSDSVCGWEPHIRMHDMTESVVMALIMISLALWVHWLRTRRFS